MKSLKVQSPFQSTLKQKVSFEGIGLHSGRTVRCTLHPAPADHGIVFLRSDLKEMPRIRADVSRVVRTDMCTTIGEGSAIVATVEHLMAALAGMGLHNALIELDGPEVPIMDGSALEFAAGIADGGLKEVSPTRKVLRLRQAVSVQHQDKWVKAEPSDSLILSGAIAFNHRIIGEQSFQFGEGSDFLTELAGARTFGFLKEVEYLHKKGLALGGSLENAVVLDDERVLNPEGLRFDDEFVRHKVLDALGDFALSGVALQAKIQLHKSGHELHAGFLAKVLENPANYEIIELQPAAPEAEAAGAIGLGLAVPA